MNAGRIAYHENITYSLTLNISASVDTDCSAQATASLKQDIATSANTKDTLFTITASYTEDTQITRTVVVDIPAIGYTQVFYGESNGKIVLEDYALYLVYQPATNTAYFRADVGALRVYTGNTLRATFTNLTAINYYLAPAGVPFLAPTVETVSPQASYYLPPLIPCANPGASITRQASIQATGIASYTVDGQPYPMRVDFLEPPEAGCGNPNPSMPTLNATDTGSVSISASASATATQRISEIRVCDDCANPDYDNLYVMEFRTVDQTVQNASITITPEVRHGWVPLAEDTRAVVQDYARPKTQAYAQMWSFREITQCPNPPDTCQENEVITQDRVPEFPAGLTTVAEETLPKAYATAPYMATVQHVYSFTPVRHACNVWQIRLGCYPNPCACFEGEPTIRTTTRISRYPDLDPVAGMNPYLNHTDNLMRFWNTVYHPHWSRFLYFTDWETGYPLSPVSKDLYWRPLRVQYLDHPDLPMPQRTKRRAHPMLEPFADADTNFLDWLEENYTGTGNRTWWFGVPRFTVRVPQRTDELTLDSSSAPRWSATGATLMFTPSGITITAAGTDAQVSFELYDRDAPPALYPMLATAVRLVATGAGLTGLTVELENAEGERIALTADPQGWYKIPQESDSYYQGSWAMTTRAGETGQDLLANGRSSDMQQDPARRVFHELFAAATAKRLHISFTLSAAGVIVLQYPRFRWVEPNTTLMTYAAPLTGNTLAVLRTQNAYQYLPFDPYTGTVREPILPPNAADFLAFERLLYEAFPVDEGAIKAVAETLYDPVELARPVDLDDLRADTRVIPRGLLQRNEEPQYLLVNALSAIPPLAMLPQRKLDLLTLTPDTTTDYGCYTYHLTPNRRYYAAVKDAMPALIRVDSDGSKTTLSMPDTTIGIYRVAHFDGAVENDETLARDYPRYHIQHGSDEIARATPFWGFWHAYSVLKGIPAQALAADARRGWIHIGIGTRIISVYQYLYTQFVERTESKDLVGLAVDTRLAVLYLLWRTGNQYQMSRSKDAGKTEEVIYMFSAESACLTTISELGMVYLAFYDGTQAYYRASLDMGNTWSAATGILLDGVGMTARPVDLAYDSRANTLIMLYRQGNSYGLAVSKDYGKTFMTVL